jgi:hypothetical protein
MKKTLIPAILIATFTLQSNAQIKLSSLSISGGDVGSSYQNSQKIDASSLFPNSIYYNGFNHDSMNANVYSNTNPNSNKGSFKISAAFLINQSKRKQQEFRIGLAGHTFYNERYESYYKNYRVDTFTSSQTGQQFFTDSNFNKYRWGQLQANSVLLDLSYLIYTKQENRFSFYTGIGLRQNICLNKKFTSVVTESGNIRNPFNSFYYPYNFTNGYSKSNIETIDAKGKLNYSLTQIYVPIGAQLRLSKRNQYLKHCYLFTELTPSITTENINKTRSTYLSMGSFLGLKIRL